MSCHDAIIHDFEQTVAKFTDSVLGLRRDASILIALSGGADSVALLLALHRLGFMCVAAHCNFHLRGEESRRDMLFCRELTGRIGMEKVWRPPAANFVTGGLPILPMRKAHKQSP